MKVIYEYGDWRVVEGDGGHADVEHLMVFDDGESIWMVVKCVRRELPSQPALAAVLQESLTV